MGVSFVSHVDFADVREKVVTDHGSILVVGPRWVTQKNGDCYQITFITVF